MHISAACPPDQVILGLWPECGQIAVAIIQNRKLSYAQSFDAAGPEVFLAEWQRFRLRAGMEGVPTDFDQIRLSDRLDTWKEALTREFHMVPQVLDVAVELPASAVNLAPAGWKADVQRRDRTRQRKRLLALGAILYLLLILAGAIHLAWLKYTVHRLEAELDGNAPELKFVQTQEKLWHALSPAINAHQSAIELLAVLHQNRPSDSLKFTLFHYEPGSFTVQGEASSAQECVVFNDKLRAEAGLQDYRLDAEQPKLLPDGSARFTVSGHLK